MKINVVGCGKMGEVYVKNLIQRLKFDPQDIFVYDIKKEKALLIGKEYGVNISEKIENLPLAPSIIASTTPSHISVIRELMKKGIKDMFCEKPLCIKSSDAGGIIGADANIYVGFLMRFSQAVNYILKKMVEENLHLSESATQWGLNFYHNQRPLIGTLIDESVHGIDIIAMLAEVNQEVERVSVSAMLTYPNYADPVVQKDAKTFDKSIPDNPDASVFANFKFVTSLGTIPANVWSSYIMAQQTRRVSGVLSDSAKKLAYAFEINFDMDQKIKDHLVITNYRSAEIERKSFPCDRKIADETNAFLDVVNGKNIDQRMTNAKQSLRSVAFTEAILKSHEKESAWVNVG